MDSAYPLGTFAKRIYAGQLASFVLTHPVRLTSVAVAELPDSGENFSPSALKLFCAPFPGSRDLIEDSDDEEEEEEDEDDEDEEDETDAERLTELQEGDELEGESEDSQGDEEDSEEGIDADDLSDDSDIEEATVTLAWLTSAQLHTKLDIFLPDGEPLGLSIEGHEDLVVDVSGHYVMLPGAESESEFDSDEEDDDDEYDLEPASDEELDMEDDDLSGPNKAYLKLLADSANAEDEDDDDDDEEEEDLPPAKPAKASKKRGAAEAGIDTDADMSTASKSGPTEEGLIQLARQAGIPEADVRDMSRNQRKRLAKKIKTGASAGAEDDDELDADEVDGATAKAEKKAAASAKAAAPVAEKKAKAETTKPSKTTTPSGLTIQTMNAPSGTSRTAKAGDRVGMRYVGKLLSTGAQFDANTKGKPFSFKLGKGEVIKGWDEGVKGMRIGEERRLTCPPHLAYGRQKLPGIPANSTLVFDIKLVEIK